MLWLLAVACTHGQNIDVTTDHELSVIVVHVIKMILLDRMYYRLSPLLLLVVHPSLITHAYPCMNV